MLAFLKNKIAIEEKVDGSNLGISVTEDYKIVFQNRSALVFSFHTRTPSNNCFPCVFRSHYVSSATATQWKGLDEWVTAHPGLWQVLNSPDLVLFGEWMYAQHSIHYTALCVKTSGNIWRQSD